MRGNFVDVKHRDVLVEVLLAGVDLLYQHWKQALEAEVEVLSLLHLLELAVVDAAQVHLKDVVFRADFYFQLPQPLVDGIGEDSDVQNVLQPDGATILVKGA